MGKPLRSMQRELEGVRRNEDIECVHRLRVASRRLRNAFRLFGEELPAAARGRWRKRLKSVRKSLGAARDLDVQISFLRQSLDGLSASDAKNRAGVEHVLNALTARRAAAQADVLGALDRLKSSRVLAGLAAWVKEQLGEDGKAAPGPDELRPEAAREVRHRLGDLFAHEPCVERPEAVEELHAMRIAAKRLRYTLEAYAPLYEDELTTRIQWVRQLQDWLGEIHDCDVWQVELGRFLEESAPGPTRRGRRQPAAGRLAAGIEHLREERARRRAAVYGEFRTAWREAAATGFWEEFREPFAGDQAATAQDRPGKQSTRAAVAGNGRPRGSNRAVSQRGARRDPAGEDFSADQRLRPVLELARSCRYEVEHTHQVTRLALRLFDHLARLHGLDEERRFWLTCAGLLHDIGWIEGRAAHHKTALRLILESPLLPWDERRRRVVGLVARYHRKALPRDRHEHFEALSGADRADVRKLAAILRIADALDSSHSRVVDDVACRVTARRLGVRCAAKRPADVECARAVEKGDLAAQVFDREVSVTWHLR